MGRPIILGNGSLTVGLNENGLVHDFYYPYVGLDNLTTARSATHNIGVWVDNKFSWVDGESWDTTTDFETDALVSDIVMKNQKMGLELHFTDFVDSEYNAFCRQITIHNKSDSNREVRLFLHQVFQISRAGRADTALFVPDDNYILDYKGRCSLLIYGLLGSGQEHDQFAIGTYGIEDREGTFRDAEDGELSGNAVEHGGVDSVLRFMANIEGQSSCLVNYWVVAADSQYSAERIHHSIKKVGLQERLRLTRDYWQKWLLISAESLQKIDQQYIIPTKKSLMVIKAHIDKRGGIIASCDSSIYNYGRDYYSYVWPRDGAYAIWPLIRLGYKDEARRFFEFCRDIVSEDGYMMHKYQPDRAIGSTWHPLLHGKRKELAIQEDETAIVVFMLGEYYDHSQDLDFVRNLYSTFIKPAADFLSQYIDQETHLPHASYDLWEEKFLTTTYTTATVYRALIIAARFADLFEFPDDSVAWNSAAADIATYAEKWLFDEKNQSYRKGFLLNKESNSVTNDDTLDSSSLYGVFMFDMAQNNKQPLLSTLSRLENVLLDKSPIGGLPRYEKDQYFKSDPPYQGNPWMVTTLWLAQYYSQNNAIDKARHYLDWSIKHSMGSGAMPEQVEPTTGQPVSVAPLVWSHAELINTVLDMAGQTQPSQNGQKINVIQQ